MDVNLSTSVILVIAVALWLFWVAPYVMRAKRARELAAAAESPAALPAAPLFRVQSTPTTGAQQTTATQQPQEAVMNTPAKGSTKIASPASATSVASVKAAPLKIHYGRTAIAGVGALALVAALVTGVLKLVGMVHALVPIVMLLIFVAAVVGLRALAIRDRRAKVSAAFRAAMGTPTAASSTFSASRPASASTTTASPRAAGTSPARVDSGVTTAASKPVFDAQTSASRTSSSPAVSSAVKPLTAAELRSAALEVAGQGDPSAAAATWQPVEVPKPAYVEAPKAERPAPAPLDLPDAPKPVAKTSIKASEAAIAAPAAGAVSTTTKPRPTHGLSNLDDVLQRRRA